MAALSSNCIAVGIHTGTIVLFRVVFDDQGYSCARTDSNRCHVNPITDLASTTINNQDFKDVSYTLQKITFCIFVATRYLFLSIELLQILVSGDETGLINIWCLKHGQLQILNNIEPPSDGFPVTTLCLYSKILKDGKYKV